MEERKISKEKLLEFIKKHKGILIKIGIIFVFLFMILTAVDKFQSDLAKKTVKAGYEEITDVPGLSFQIQKIALDASTAVMEISSKVNFATNETYMYRNGKDTYLLFNMNNFIVVAKKGTTFHFESNSVTESLEKNSLNGIWFTLIGKEGSVKKEKGRYEMNVNAQVVITNDLYNDFIGKLIVFTEEDTEWAFFVGSPNKKTPFYESELDVILASLKRCDNDRMILDSYEVDMGSGSFASAEKVDKEQTKEENADVPTIEESKEPEAEPSIEEPSIEEPSIEEPSVEEPSIEEPSVEEPSVEEPEDIPVIVLPPESSSAPTDTKPSETEEKPAKEEQVKEPEIPNAETETEDGVHFDSNQEEIVREESKAYTSSIYAMLKVGDTGYMDIADDHKTAGSYSGAYIKVRKLLAREEAQKVIDDYIASGKAYYTEMTPPDGCHFEAVIYDVQYKTDYDLYTNIKFLGIDGEALRFRGIRYSDRTYDILSKEREGGWIVGNICFYLVPNGCKEYVLKCGDGTSEIFGFGAYYHIEVE